MKIKNFLAIFFIIICVVFIQIGLKTVAYGYTLQYHAYAAQHSSPNNYGGYYYSPYGQAYLSSGWTIYNHAVITNEIWVFGPGSYYWIEGGDVDGDINGNYWAGTFLAYNDQIGYTEIAVGPMYRTGATSTWIQKTGTYNWDVYTCGNKILSLTMPFSYSAGMEAGVETINSNSYFFDGLYDQSLQYKDTSTGAWINWPSSSNVDDNPFGWKSSFNDSTDSISFTK